MSSMWTLFLVRFSTERKEAESASLSAKEESWGRLIEGDQRGGGVAEDASDNPHPALHPPHPPLPLPASVRCLRQRASGSCWLSSDPESAESEPPPANPPHRRGWSKAFFGFLFDASCLNFFLLLCIKEEKKKKSEEKFSTETNVYSEDLTHW